MACLAEIFEVCFFVVFKEAVESETEFSGILHIVFEGVLFVQFEVLVVVDIEVLVLDGDVAADSDVESDV